ncbi:site-specific tyrosine recombinase XerC [compost metagenome]
MSDSAERYLKAARRDSTQRRYAQAVEHFEEEWGGMLPASSESIVRYLAAYGAQLASNTLRTHLAALVQWHQQHGFDDPTKTSRVRDVLRGVQARYPQPIKQAEALQLQRLEACIEGLGQQMTSDQWAVRQRAARDQALILMGFWRALRGDELCRLQVEHIQLREGLELEIFLASSKTDRDHRGRTLVVPALKRLCPVDAYQHWLLVSGINQGPVFRAIDRWGHLADERVNPNSLSRILRLAFVRSGVDGERYTAHSLRRGFATWASRNKWSSKALMEYVGWRDVQSAARYIEADAPFGDWIR